MIVDLEALDDAAACHGIDAVYAVGDIHGRTDLAMKMDAMIAADIVSRSHGNPVICYLGDYVDKGPDSAGTIEYLLSRDDGIARIFLKGNHEDRLLRFVDAPEQHGSSLLKHGGREAFTSYGIEPGGIEPGDFTAVRDRFVVALPETHRHFFHALSLAWSWGNYLFVHAGIHPDKPLAEQDSHDLMWIREPFQSSDREFGRCVVHGHVVVDKPVVRPNRIGIDTGAFASGVLSTLALDLRSRRILQTTND